MAISPNESAACPYPPSVLDFVDFRGLAASTVDESWPCEVRTFWVHDLRPFVEAVRFIYAYFTLFVVALGMLLNFFALRVWSSRAMSGTSLSVYLRALSLSDMGALICTYFLGYWRSHHPGFNELFLNNESICRFHKVVVSMFPMTSQWLQTALTVERLLVVWRPLRARNPYYPQLAARAARRTVGVVYLTLILVALTKWHFSGFEQYSAFEYQRCEHNAHSSVVAVYVYVALSTYLPGTIIFVSNVMLFLRLRRSDSLRRSLFAGSAHDGACYGSDAAARTLLLFSLLYLLLQLPLGVVETAELYWDVTLYHPPTTDPVKRKAYIFWLNTKLQLKWARGLLFWLFQLSFVLNFVVYLKSGGRFRAVAKGLAWHWLTCGLSPLRTAGRSLSTLPHHLGVGLGSSLGLGRGLGRGLSRSLCRPAAAYGTTGCYVPPPSSSGTASELISDIPMAASSPTLAPMTPSGSTGSISSEASSGGLASPGGLGLCWRLSRQPRPRTRTNSCPHRHSLRRSSPCPPCRRARIQTWANTIRTQGLKALRHASSPHGRVFLSANNSSMSSLVKSSDGDVESDSVFDSPAFVGHPEDAVVGAGKAYPQQDLLSWPLQDPGGTYASPLALGGPPLRDADGAYTNPAVFVSDHDLLGGPASLQRAPGAGALAGTAGSALAQRRVLFRSERALHLAVPGADVEAAAADGGGAERRRVTVSVSRANLRLERYLSEPHR